MKEQKKNKGRVLVAESAYNAQNAQFGLVMEPAKNVTLDNGKLISRNDKRLIKACLLFSSKTGKQLRKRIRSENF